MKNAKHMLPAVLGTLIALGAFPAVARARVPSEIETPDIRRISVEKAALIAKRSKAAPLPAELAQPFAPAGFELTDAEEAAAAAAAARRAGATGQGGAAPAPLSDRELLQSIVAKVKPSGTIYVGNQPMLMFGKRFVKTGSHFTVTYKGTDYDLELTDIDGSNFTLRYNHVEITRPIQPGKTP